MSEHEVDEVDNSMVMATTALLRGAETALRHARERAERTAAEQRDRASDLERRYAAQAATAEGYFREAARPEMADSHDVESLATAWQAAREWADLDEARFAPYADHFAAEFRTAYDVDLDVLTRDLGGHRAAARRAITDHNAGRETTPRETFTVGDQRAANLGAPAYDSDDARANRSRARAASGMAADTVAAMDVADHFDGTDPRAAATRDRSARRAVRVRRSREALRSTDRGGASLTR